MHYVTETLKSHQDTYQLNNTKSNYSHSTIDIPKKKPLETKPRKSDGDIVSEWLFLGDKMWERSK